MNEVGTHWLPARSTTDTKNMDQMSRNSLSSASLKVHRQVCLYWCVYLTQGGGSVAASYHLTIGALVITF